MARKFLVLFLLTCTGCLAHVDVDYDDQSVAPEKTHQPDASEPPYTPDTQQDTGPNPNDCGYDVVEIHVPGGETLYILVPLECDPRPLELQGSGPFEAT